MKKEKEAEGLHDLNFFLFENKQLKTKAQLSQDKQN